MANLTQLAEQLVNLTVKEVKELTDILKDQYGIEPAAAGAVVVASAGGAGGFLYGTGSFDNFTYFSTFRSSMRSS